MALLALHRRFLNETVQSLAQDPAVAAVLLSGSGGRGEADDWSDLDLAVVVDDDAGEQYLGHAKALEAFGDLVVWVDCSFNAPPGGSMSFSRYLVDASLVLVDWSIWPRALARHTEGSVLLWSRAGVDLAPFDGNLVDLVLSSPRREPPPYSRQQRAEWELCMVHIAASRPARGQDASEMLKLIGHAEPPTDTKAQLDLLDAQLEDLKPWLAPRAWHPSRDRLIAVRKAADHRDRAR
jgi:predicted nucleotidyltransferase